MCRPSGPGRLMSHALLTLSLFWLQIVLPSSSLAAQGDPASPGLAPVIAINAKVVAIEHVRIIDGTGSPAAADQTVVLSEGKVTVLGSATSLTAPLGATIVDGTGRTLLPGYVGTHNHLFTGYVDRFHIWRNIWREMPFSYPRLYLAAGTTSLRTTGSMDVLTDIHLKSSIDAGLAPGPRIDLTSPFLTGPGNHDPQMQELRDGADARATVSYWADHGVTSFKVYTNVSLDAFTGVVEEAHRRGLKVLGHLCTVTFLEEASAGIDELEHGILTDSEFVQNRKPGECPPPDKVNKALLALDVDGEEVGSLIRELLSHRVVISSTLAVFESIGALPSSDASFKKTLILLAPEIREGVIRLRDAIRKQPAPWGELLKKEMAFEHRFFLAGGVLTAGPDPSAYGAVVAGIGDWRDLELLVEAGFTPIEAIKIASANGAVALGRIDSVGTIEPGKLADLILVRGDPSINIEAIEDVEIVFKEGIGFDSKKLFDSVRGIVGRY